MRGSSTFLEKPQVRVLLITTTDHAATKGLTSGSQVVWVTFLGFRKLPYSYIQCATPLHVHPTSRYVTVHGQLYPTLVLQATNAGGEGLDMRLHQYKVCYWPDPHTDLQHVVCACILGAFLEWEWTFVWLVLAN